MIEGRKGDTAVLRPDGMTGEGEEEDGEIQVGMDEVEGGALDAVLHLRVRSRWKGGWWSRDYGTWPRLSLTE